MKYRTKVKKAFNGHAVGDEVVLKSTNYYELLRYGYVCEGESLAVEPDSPVEVAVEVIPAAAEKPKRTRKK
jgi:hypothetical protein